MATENGLKIMKAVRYLREFMEQLALVLQTCDKLMSKRGWACVHGSTALTETWKSLDNPQYWMPKEAFRFYGRSDQLTNSVVFVSILIDDVGQDYKRVDEPILSAGVFVYEADYPYYEAAKPGGGFDYTWAREQGWATENHDGHVTVQPRQTWTESDRKEAPHLLIQATFGYPLVEFGDSKDIETKVIQPVLELVEEQEAARDAQ